MIQTHTADLEGMHIHYAEMPGPGPALVNLHGITGAYTTFLLLLPQMAAWSHVYALDLRGHGASGRMAGAYQVADYGRDVLAFLQRVVGRPAVVAGHSLGALIALWLAAEAPDWVQGIFLEDPPLYITQSDRLPATYFYGYFVVLRDFLRQHHARGGTLDDVVAFVSQLPASATQNMLELAGAAKVHTRSIELQNIDPAILDPTIAGILLGDLVPDDLLARVRCPLHLLAADVATGGAMDAQDVARFVAHAPACTHTVLPGTGHGIHEERPTVYVEALQAFTASAQ